MVTNTIANETYVLSQCGVAPPAADSFPAGTKFFTVPLTTLSAPETVPYTFVVRPPVCVCHDAGVRASCPWAAWGRARAVHQCSVACACKLPVWQHALNPLTCRLLLLDHHHLAPDRTCCAWGTAFAPACILTTTPSCFPPTMPRQDMLNLGDRVHDVSQFITSPCGQALLECPNGDRLSPGSGDDYVQLRCVCGVCVCGGSWRLPLPRLRRRLRACSPPHSSHPIPAHSNATYLGEQLASVTDGVMLTAALDYPESFAVSAAQDPGEC